MLGSFDMFRGAQSPSHTYMSVIRLTCTCLGRGGVDGIGWGDLHVMIDNGGVDLPDGAEWVIFWRGYTD